MSSSKQVVLTENAPKPIPVLSQAIIHNGVVYCSGQTGTDPKTMQLVEGDIQARTRQILENLKAVVEAAGSGMEHALKVNVFLTDMANFAAVNEIYGQYFPDPKPVRTCVAVHQLPLGTDVEIEMSAIVPN
ncbi:protein Mmf1p, mitochondrial [Trichomonascus vanleenenianus]|uniref:protein Mmf1p, mitochondrial n=1 Tax=Trichomonascus vanleenenianus TaxID=2268995 RepID=UPI003EC9CE97